MPDSVISAQACRAPAARLSVIVPVLNEEAVIVDTLQSLAPLRLMGAEVIVVDGGSVDETARLATPLADRLLRSEKGRARQMNLGAAAASGEVLLFLHADSSLPHAASDLILGRFLASGRAWGHFDVCITGRPWMLKVIAALMNLRSRLTGIATGDQAIFVRRRDFVAVKGFPLQPLMEDIELSRRLGQRSRPLCLRQQVTTSGRRWLACGVWRTIVLMWRLRISYRLGVPAEKLVKAYR